MNIYSQISANRIKTFLVFIVFALITFAFFAIVGRMVGFGTQAYVMFSIVMTLGSALVSYYYSDKIVLMSVGAKPATKEEHFHYYTAVENLSMAAGIPMPKVYVMEDPSPNAFATGRNPKHAAVCASTGLLRIMDRSELEGVIAHELAHIKNYDILLSTVVGATVGVISNIAQHLMFFNMVNSDEQDNRNPLFYVLYIVAIIVVPFLLYLIQLSISRRREYLADASGALLTRYPEGLARALEKIKTYTRPSTVIPPGQAHLMFADPYKGKVLSWLQTVLSTHPPIEERIRILRGQ